MRILYFLEGIRVPALDTFFSIITRLGTEPFMIAAAVVVLWCVSKRNGYYLILLSNKTI